MRPSCAARWRGSWRLSRPRSRTPACVSGTRTRGGVSPTCETWPPALPASAASARGRQKMAPPGHFRPAGESRACRSENPRVCSMSPMELPHRTLEQLLVEQGRITQDDLRKVKRLQQERGERLERLLLDLGFISEEDLLPLLSAYLGVETIHRRDFPTAPVPLGNLNLKFLKHAKVLPLAQTNGGLTVAMSDPADYYTIQGLELATGLQVEPRLARERDVLEALETIYGGGNAEGGAAAEPADAELEYL